MNHIEKTIEELKQKVVEKEQELNEAQKTVNSLCAMMGKPPIYALEEQSSVATIEQLRGDEYYGRPLATVITTILEARKIQGAGPAKVKEIYKQMMAGGYQFDTKNEVNAMRGMRISMAKNQKFHKLPNGKWGLTEWYPNVKESKEQAKAENEIVSKILKEEKNGSKTTSGE